MAESENNPEDLNPEAGAPGGVPPSDVPPGGPVAGGADDPNDPQTVVNLIRMVSGQQVDQLRADNDLHFVHIEAQISEIVGAVNQMSANLAKVVSAQGQVIAADNDQSHLAPGQATPPAAGFNPRDALASLAMQILNDPAKLTEIISGLAQAKNAWKPPTDLIGVLSHIQQTNPQLLSLFVPDAMGGRFPDLQAKAVGVGMDVMKSALASTLKANGIAPLVNAGPVNSSVSPGPAMSQDVAAPAAPNDLSGLSDEQITGAVAQLMQEKVDRRNKAAGATA